MRFEVTAEDIAYGVRMDCRLCPVARAISKQLRRASFNGGCINRWTDGGLFRVMVPDSAKRFALTFDSGARVIEFSFNIPAENFVEYPRQL